MLIEIRRVGFKNKGAELMLHAIIQQLKSRYPNASLVIVPTGSQGPVPYIKAAKLGFFLKAFLWKYAIQWGDLAAFIPKFIRDRYGIILDNEVDVVIDAAGFAYSDQWGTGSSKELARSSKRWARRESTLILMPQAFGPFNKSESIKKARIFMKNASLIFAREDESFRNITRVTGNISKMKTAPDFTNLVVGALPNDYQSKENSVAIIPNYRMIDKTSDTDSTSYIPFMAHCIKRIKDHGMEPFILIHEGEDDAWLAEEISTLCNGIRIIRESDPIYIKGIIGTCTATIGSRFHGLVSALSQGVPSLATGWSHKYKNLLEDYSFQEGIVSASAHYALIDQKIETLIDAAYDPQKRRDLLARAEEQKKEVRQMWTEIFSIIDKK